ncbi:MAG: hypothetical protein ABI780_06905 [Ardenticatenales bacterium]
MTRQPLAAPISGWITDAVGLVWLSGADRLSFLHRMSTNRVADLAVGEGRSTVLVSDAGRVVDVVGCHHAVGGTVLVTSAPAAAPVVAAHLSRYTLRDDVRVTDATGQVVVRRVVGDRAIAMVERLVGAIPVPPTGAFVDHGEGAASIWALRHTAPWPDSGWDIVMPAAASSEPFDRAGITTGVEPLSAGDYAMLRIRHRLPAFGAEIDGTANPLELGLIRQIDFGKGCYIGQEIVARLDTYQKVQRRLVTLHGDAPMSVGDVVHPKGVPPTSRRRDGLGRITSVASDGDGSLALAIVPSAWLNLSSTALEIGDDQPVRLLDASDESRG